MALPRVSTRNLEYPGDGLHYLDGIPFTGVLEYHRRDGTLDGEEEYKDGESCGHSREWFPSGRLRMEAECRWGRYHGQVREWHENGQIANHRVYAYGIKVEGLEWDESGALVGEYHIPDSMRPQIETYRAALEE